MRTETGSDPTNLATYVDSASPIELIGKVWNGPSGSSDSGGRSNVKLLVRQSEPARGQGKNGNHLTALPPLSVDSITTNVQHRAPYTW